MTTVPIDLSRDLEAALDGPVDLVTTSALLDLVSDDWLDRLAVEAAARRLPVYAALSYDGRVELTPADAADERIVDAVNRISAPTRASVRRSDQRRRRPRSSASSASAMRWCRARPIGCSDRQDREIQTEMLSGWAAAAREIGDVAAAPRSSTG